MNDSLTTRGFVATPPNHIVTSEGLAITTFRLRATRRRYNRETSSWENGETNWFTVTAFRQLASNVVASVAKGDPVIVSGRLRVRQWETEERSGIAVEIDAESIGHDLAPGSSSFSPSVKRTETRDAATDDDSPHDAPVAHDADDPSPGAGQSSSTVAA